MGEKPQKGVILDAKPGVNAPVHAVQAYCGLNPRLATQFCLQGDAATPVVHHDATDSPYRA